MPLSYRPVAVEDNGPRRFQQQAELAEYNQKYNGTAAQKAVETQYQQRLQAEQAAARQKVDEEEEEKRSGKYYAPTGGMTVPKNQRARYGIEEEEEEPAAPEPAVTPRQETPVVTPTPETTETQTPGINAAQKPKEQTAPAPIIYSAPGINAAQKPSGRSTKTELETSENDQAWYEENGLAWAAPQNQTSTTGVNASQKPKVNAEDLASARRAGYEPDRDIAKYAAQVWNGMQTPAAPAAVPVTAPATTQPTIESIGMQNARENPWFNEAVNMYVGNGVPLREAEQLAYRLISMSYDENMNPVYPFGDKTSATPATTQTTTPATTAAAPAMGVNASIQYQAQRAAQRAAQQAEDNELWNDLVRIGIARGMSQADAEAAANSEVPSHTAGITYQAPPAASVGISDIVYRPASQALNELQQEGRQIASSLGLEGMEAENYAVTYANRKANREQIGPERTVNGQPAATVTGSAGSAAASGTPTTTGTRTTPGAQAGMSAEEAIADIMRRDGLTRDQAIRAIQMGVYPEYVTKRYSTGNNTPETTASTGTPTAEGTGTNNRPGADTALEDVMGSQTLGVNGSQRPKDYEAGTASGSGTSGSGSSSGKAPKGSTYFTPSYGQDMTKGVKAPYRAEGYTASEIEAMGNKARSDQKYYNGSKAYEGYYLAPNGKYYPVDQEKAAYYKANGGSYEGWEEPMREYYKTFGTYYGYRPDWKTAGRSSYGGYSYSPRSYSYSRGGNSYGGSSYGSGSPANNGLYWNPNSSWSI